LFFIWRVKAQFWIRLAFFVASSNHYQILLFRICLFVVWIIQHNAHFGCNKITFTALRSDFSLIFQAFLLALLFIITNFHGNHFFKRDVCIFFLKLNDKRWNVCLIDILWWIRLINFVWIKIIQSLIWMK